MASIMTFWLPLSAIMTITCSAARRTFEFLSSRRLITAEMASVSPLPAILTNASPQATIITLTYSFFRPYLTAITARSSPSLATLTSTLYAAILTSDEGSVSRQPHNALIVSWSSISANILSPSTATILTTSFASSSWRISARMAFWSPLSASMPSAVVAARRTTQLWSCMHLITRAITISTPSSPHFPRTQSAEICDSTEAWLKLSNVMTN
mmetsp:Transcript_97507/g.209200  ORF Transcript_97507/g.209200 Transcript_97507/m.209200 type:complete len:212 (+) Transcript_97507:440-1075(+)